MGGAHASAVAAGSERREERAAHAWGAGLLALAWLAASCPSAAPRA